MKQHITNSDDKTQIVFDTLPSENVVKVKISFEFMAARGINCSLSTLLPRSRVGFPKGNSLDSDFYDTLGVIINAKRFATLPPEGVVKVIQAKMQRGNPKRERGEYGVNYYPTINSTTENCLADASGFPDTSSHYERAVQFQMPLQNSTESQFTAIQIVFRAKP